MNSCGVSSHLNHRSSTCRSRSYQKKKLELASSSEDSGLSDLEVSECDKQWGEIEECPKKDCFELEPDHLILKEVLNIEKENVINTLELFNPSRTISCSVPQDPITKHTAQLLKFAEEMTDQIKQISLVIQEAKAGKLLDSSKFLKRIVFPPIPKNFPVSEKLRAKIVELCSENPFITPHAILGTVSENTAVKPETHKQVKEPFLLTEDSHRKLLVRSLAFFLHYAGYTSVDSETLDILVSTVNNFFEDVLDTLKKNIELETFSDGQENLQHSLDKTLSETGFGGIKGLFIFYQEHVIYKHQDALEYCLKLHRTFSSSRRILEELQCENADKKDQLQPHAPSEDSSSKLKHDKKKPSIFTRNSYAPSKKCYRQKPMDEKSLPKKKIKKVQ